MDCKLCEISQHCRKSLLMGTGKKAARIMFVADNPTDFEDKQRKWMVGKAGNLFKNVLEQVGINLEDCYFTGAVKCPTPDDGKGQRQPLKDEIENCSPYLDAEIEVIDPEIIVPLGNVALKKVYGKTGITKFRGKAVEDKNGRIVFPILHPDIIFRQPKHAENFAKDIQNLAILLDSGKGFLERSDVDYRYLETYEEIEEEVNRLEEEAEWLVFDLETTSLNPFLPNQKIVCISLTDKHHYGVTIPLEHKEFVWPGIILDKIKGLLKRLLEHNKRIKKVAHNGKFDMKWLLAKYGIDVSNFAFDPMLAHYVAVTEERGGHGLKELAWEHTDMGGYDNALDEYKATLPEAIRHNYDNIPWKILREYAAADVDCTMRLIPVFKPMIEANPKWKEAYDKLFILGSYALRDIEMNGIKLSEERLAEFDTVFPERIKEIEDKLRQYPEVIQIEREKLKMFETRQLEMKKPKAERDPEILKWNKYKNFKFNFGSVVQLRELLFERLGLTTPFLTDKGDEKRRKRQEITIDEMSTGSETLEYLEDKHPIASLLSEWRKLDKLYGTYIAPANTWIGEDGLVHPTFNLTGTVTTRLSSEAPNAQNFPRKSNDPFAFNYKYGVKKLFVSRFGDDGVIMQFDYSQLELRVAAMFSNDPQLLQAYRDGKDLHIYAAAKVRGIPEEDVTDDMRTAAKAVNFGLLYGKGARSLAEDMKMTLEEAQDFIDKYFEEFKGVKKWLDDTRKKLKQEKHVETLTGLWRRLPGVDSNDRGVQADAQRQGVNSPIQGSGANMTMMSIILINDEFKKQNLKSKIAITVHDSIVADTHITEIKQVYTIMKGIMENLPFDWITVPIISDAEIGRDYGTLVGIDDIDAVLEEGVFEFIDREVEEKHQKALKKAQKSA
ncbi:DNA polymerase family A [Lysinibacillus phage vB_LfM_LysYB1]|nr:DNA polymerase family A [Lysinibacillus phage vB_LfM_LysYB1]WAB25198.1 DNA polymerase family A [Lysinibacillus phage vB_LfM_LysYB2]